ncbi:MAG TPA: DNA-directed RNA polymerase subunit beta' [Spirochaetota bacterium]|nr:DNA-directed RNA polymerase subunit beta' [Spirochaetota bacterium]HPQ48434.1 DNA-directed RNA polymerase subunit beta' [Spirochaetota bacterium]
MIKEKENKKFAINDIKKIKVMLASPERIVNDWSYGEVTKAETVNYRSFKPEDGGLFCEKIFGTTKDWECKCGKYKSRVFEGITCDKCGVTVTHSRVRRERIGHIKLAIPVAHIWFYRVNPCRIGLILGLSSNEVKDILFYEKYIVINKGDTDLKEREVLTEEQFEEVKSRYYDFKIGTGAEALREILKQMDLEKEAEKVKLKIQERINKGKDPNPKDLKRLELINDFIKSGNRPEWMILTHLPVIPPELRPMVQLEGGRFATSDLNDIYRRVINRNNRLSKLKAKNAPDIILKNEKRMLQEAVDALLDNTRSKKTIKVNNNRPLKSLSDLFKGKQGRFRQNLLGKRVDYSGRSVIVIGPKLKMYQCGIPKDMAVELFKPFIIRELKNRGLATHIKEARELIDRKDSRIWDILEEVIQDHPVLLNRAPTLHRLGIQAFQPILVEGKAIQLHPLVCKGYNADFDGDQMAIHVPLSIEAQLECWMLMLSSKNLLDPANGKPIVTPTQDILLGLYILTKKRPGDKGEGKVFSSFEEALKAYDAGYLSINAGIKIWYRNKYKDTTLGRVIFNSKFPSNHPFINETIDDKKIKAIISELIYKYGHATTVEILDEIKELGYHYSTKYGIISIGIDDIIIPEEKYELVKQTEKEIEKIEKSYREGILSDQERYNRVVEKWNEINNKIKNIMFNKLSKDRNGFNPIFMMADSGARGSKEQIRQLAGMRGLMAKPSGEIIEVPIKSNFKEGLTVLEYFNSTHGARKGLADTALKTADAGYLTRKLVDVAQNIIITEEDCGTDKGILVKAIKSINEDKVIESLADRIVGRFLAEDVYHPATKELIASKNTEIDENLAGYIEKTGIEEVKIRSVLTCESEKGLCVKCYGRNLATGKRVEVGEAVGIAAAQSIGQPGTQLTMRTFHIGGVASVGGAQEGKIVVKIPVFIVSLPKYMVKKEDYGIVTRNDVIVVKNIVREFLINDLKEYNVEENQKIYPETQIGIDKDGNIVKAGVTGIISIKDDTIFITKEESQINVKPGTKIYVEEGDFVERDKEIGEVDFNVEFIVAEIDGIVRYENIFEGTNLKLEREIGKKVQKYITESKAELLPKVIIESKNGELAEYPLPEGCLLNVDENEEIKAGDIIARVAVSQIKVKDITGGLPKVTELFEARVPKNCCFLAKEDGVVEILKKSKNKYILSLTYTDEEGETHKIKYGIPTNRTLFIRNGEYVKKGQPLCSGEKNPHDILKILGPEAVSEYLLEKIQEVYREQGVQINDKHISIIIRQMLSKVEITDPGDTDLIMKQKIDKIKLEAINKKVISEGGAPAIAKPILMGITKTALNTDSFIAAASFQETTRILTKACIKGLEDELVGLKENVIIGHMIPAGTGYVIRQKLSSTEEQL